MSTCPKGHPSAADDYCDVCGARIGMSRAPASAPGPATVDAASSSAIPTAAPTTPTEPSRKCPACGATNVADHTFCEDCGANLDQPPSPPDHSEPAVPGLWEAVARADRAYFERLDAGDLEFPVSYTERRFALSAMTARIGRRSPGRLDPDIDLAPAPEDLAVSHQHAVLRQNPDNGWTIVDEGSANGTYLNDSDTPVPRNQPVTLGDGDRIHLGAWTTLTLRRLPSP